MENKFAYLIREIASSSGRLDKISHLLNHTGSYDVAVKEVFDEFLNYVFRVDYSYGVTLDPSWQWTAEKAQAHIGLDQLFDLFDDLRERKLSGNAALAQTQLTLECAANEDIFFLGKLILKRSLDCGLDKKTLGKYFPALLPFVPSMMKCEPAEEKSLKNAIYPGMLQLKIDAMRVNAEVTLREETSFWTFNGNQFEIDSEDLIHDLSALYAQLRPKYGDIQFIDGELQIYSLGKPLPRKKSNGQANRILKGTAPIDVHENAHIVVWDILSQEDVVKKKSIGTNLERFTDLKNAIEKLNLKYVHLVEHMTVNSEEEAYEQVYKWIERGEEGGVFKNSDAVWEGKRSANCIKFKAERECELRVIGWNAGKDKYEGLVGSLICHTDDDGIIVDVSGMSDDDRYQWTADITREVVVRRKRQPDGTFTTIEYQPCPVDEIIIGDVIGVLFNEVIASEKRPGKLSLFLGRIIERRFDKDETDTTEVVKAAKGMKKSQGVE